MHVAGGVVERVVHASGVDSPLVDFVLDPPGPHLFFGFVLAHKMVDHLWWSVFVIWVVPCYFVALLLYLEGYPPFGYMCMLYQLSYATLLCVCGRKVWNDKRLRAWVNMPSITRLFYLRGVAANVPDDVRWLRYMLYYLRIVPLPIKEIMLFGKVAAALVGASVVLNVGRVTVASLRGGPRWTAAGGFVSVPRTEPSKGRGPGLKNVEPLDVLYSVETDTVSVKDAPNIFATVLVLVTLDGGLALRGISTGEVLIVPAHFARYIVDKGEELVEVRISYVSKIRCYDVVARVNAKQVWLDLKSDRAVIALEGLLPRVKPGVCKLFPLVNIEAGSHPRELSGCSVLVLREDPIRLELEPAGMCCLVSGSPNYDTVMGIGAPCFWECEYKSKAGDCGHLLLDPSARVLGRLVASGRTWLFRDKTIFMPMEPLRLVSEYKPQMLFKGSPLGDGFQPLREFGPATLATGWVMPIGSMGGYVNTDEVRTRPGPAADVVQAFAVERGIKLDAPPDLGWMPSSKAPGGFANWELKALIKSQGVPPVLGHEDLDLVAELIGKYTLCRVKLAFPGGLGLLNRKTIVTGGVASSPLRLNSSNGFGGPVGKHRVLVEPDGEGRFQLKSEVFEQVQEALSKARCGTVDQTVVRAFSKDEARDCEADGTPKAARVIWVANAVSVLSERVFADYVTACCANLPCSRVGCNVYRPEEAAGLERVHQAAAQMNGGGLYELDGVGMDSNQVRPTMRSAIETVCYVMTASGEDAGLVNACREVFKASLDPLWVIKNDVLARERGLPSGSGATSYVNTWASVASHLLCCLWYVPGCRDVWLRLSLCGSDVGPRAWIDSFEQFLAPANIYSDDVSECFDEEQLNKAAAFYGLKYENQHGAKVMKTPETITFLRRRFVKRGSDRVWAPLDLGSIVKMLMFETPPSKETELAGARRDRVRSAHRELCLHGEAVHEEWLPVLRAVWKAVSDGLPEEFQFELDPWARE